MSAVEPRGPTANGASASAASAARPERLAFLVDAARRLARCHSWDATLAALVELAVPTLGDDVMLLLPAPRSRLQWWHRAGRTGRVTSGLGRAPAGNALPTLTAALGGTRPAAVELPAAERRAPYPPTRHLATLGPVVVTSLHADDGCEGALVVARDARVARFDAADLELLAEFAALSATAIRAARHGQDQRRALDVLTGALSPPVLPTLAYAQLAGCSRPAKGQLAVSGDFYDVHTLQGAALLVFGDVAGNGPEAAVITSRIRSAVAALTLVEKDPARLLYLLNEAMLSAGTSRFATVVIGSMVPADGLTITLSSGGHPAPLLLRADATVAEVLVPGTLVGVLPHARFGKTVITLAPGELCLLYSDGITEARGGPQGDQVFGQHRLVAALAGCAGLPAAEVIARIEQVTAEWLADGDRDDIAMLAVRA